MKSLSDGGKRAAWPEPATPIARRGRRWLLLPLLVLATLAVSAAQPRRADAFAKDVHTTILQTALGDKMNADALALVEGYNWVVIGAGNQGNDIASGQVMPFLHFDNSKNPNDICDRWQEGVNDPLRRAVMWVDQFALWDAFSNTGDYEALSRKQALADFGDATHALEDFYSHSNWVEISSENGTLDWTRGIGYTPTAPLLGAACDPNAFPADQISSGPRAGELVQTGYVSLALWFANWIQLHIVNAWCSPLGPPTGFKYCHDDLAKDDNSGYGAKPITPEQVTDTTVLGSRFKWAKGLAEQSTADAWPVFTGRAKGAINADAGLTAKGVNADCIINKLANGGNANCFNSTPPSSGCWSGKWTGSDNDLNLTQSGNTVMGSWDGDSNSDAFQGTVSGNVLTGTWYNGSRGGSLTYTMESNCQQFSGNRWDCYMATPPSGQGGSPQCSTGNFTPIPGTYHAPGGTSALPSEVLDAALPSFSPLSGTAPSPGSQMQPLDWTMPFQTSKGLIQLTPSGYTLTGSYDQGQGQIIAVAVDNVLQGAWFHAPSYQPPNDAGDFDFVLSDDGSSLTGRWDNASDGVWHTDWTGSRTSAPASPPQGAPIPWLASSTRSGSSSGTPSPSPSPSGGGTAASPSPSPSSMPVSTGPNGAPTGNNSSSGPVTLSGGSAPKNVGCIPCDGQARFMGPGQNGAVALGLGVNNAGEASVAVAEPAGTLRNLHVQVSASDGGIWNFGLWVNGAPAGGLSCNIDPTKAPGQTSCQNTTASASIKNGDKIALGIGNPGNPLTQGSFTVTWSVELDPAGTANTATNPTPQPSPPSTQGSGPTPTPDAELDLYYSAARGDNFTTATTQGASDAQAAGYRYVRVEGYVYPAH